MRSNMLQLTKNAKSILWNGSKAPFWSNLEEGSAELGRYSGCVPAQRRANSLRALHVHTHIQVNNAHNQSASLQVGRWPSLRRLHKRLSVESLTECTPFALNKRLVQQSTSALAPFWFGWIEWGYLEVIRRNTIALQGLSYVTVILFGQAPLCCVARLLL